MQFVRALSGMTQIAGDKAGEKNQRMDELFKELEQPRRSVPVGFVAYPIAQAADVTAFNATDVPVGEDQLPVMEMTNEVVRTFNRIYGDVLVEPKAIVPREEESKRLPGIFGVDDKMSKSLNNGIYLADSPDEVAEKVMKMYTDPQHIKVDDPGHVDGNVVFYYLDVFAKDKKKVAELKTEYKKGGLGDVAIKKYLVEVLEEILAPIRVKRAEYEKDLPTVKKILEDGSEKANKVAAETLAKVRAAIGLNYFNVEK
jgi:tryptophanyl-tRNA synthetase